MRALNHEYKRRSKGDRVSAVEVRPGFLERQQSSVPPILYSVTTSHCVSFPQLYDQSEDLRECSQPAHKGKEAFFFINKLSAMLGQMFPLAYMKTKLISIKSKLYFACCDFLHNPLLKKD